MAQCTTTEVRYNSAFYKQVCDVSSRYATKKWPDRPPTPYLLMAYPHGGPGRGSILKDPMLRVQMLGRAIVGTGTVCPGSIFQESGCDQILGP